LRIALSSCKSGSAARGTGVRGDGVQHYGSGVLQPARIVERGLTMLSKKMEKALNSQINAELASSFLYLSMSAQFMAQISALAAA
jgi:hypothetical protein